MGKGRSEEASNRPLFYTKSFAITFTRPPQQVTLVKSLYNEKVTAGKNFFFVFPVNDLEQIWTRGSCVHDRDISVLVIAVAHTTNGANNVLEAA